MIKASLHKIEAFVVNICVKAFVVFCCFVVKHSKKTESEYWIMVFELCTEVSIFPQGHCCYNLVSLTFLNSCYIESIILVNKSFECKSRFGFNLINILRNQNLDIITNFDTNKFVLN